MGGNTGRKSMGKGEEGGWPTNEFVLEKDPLITHTVYANLKLKFKRTSDTYS